MEQDSVHCCIVKERIPRIVCDTLGNRGDCQFCFWNGIIRPVVKPGASDNLDPELSTLFSSYMVSEFTSRGIERLSDMLGLSWQELVNLFSSKTAAKVRNTLIQ